MQTWELAAREHIRDTLARYNWSGDSARLDDMAHTFCADCELQLRGEQPLRGRSAIVEFLLGITTSATQSEMPRIVRHNLTNIRFLEVAPQQARVASYFTVFTEIGLDHYGRYRDTFVPVDDEWLIRHRFVSTDWAAANSTMAPQIRT